MEIMPLGKNRNLSRENRSKWAQYIQHKFESTVFSKRQIMGLRAFDNSSHLGFGNGVRLN